jgi:nicotinate phosphoribosyltransferase
LDEHRIADLKSRGCKIGVWGVGTRLATGHPDGSLGGVYKLAAIRDANGGWNHKLKLSDDPVKRTLPGIQQVRRFGSGDRHIADVIFNEASPPDGDWVSFALGGPGQKSGQKRTFGRQAEAKNLLAPILRAGDLVDDYPALDQVRQHTLDELDRLADPVKRLVDPEVYQVGVESGLRGLEQDLIRRIRGPAPRQSVPR